MKQLCLLLVGLAFMLPCQAMGGTIPVFRYALENGELTRYEILVFQRGPLPTDLHRRLEKCNANPNKANVVVTYFDLDKQAASNENDNRLNTWRREGKAAQTPWMLVRYRGDGDQAATGWSGPCTIANLQKVLDSPKRQALLAHLRAGASAVFVLLTSGDRGTDQAAYDLAFAELQKLEQKIKLGEPSKEGPPMRLPLPLHVSFPLVKLDRHDPEEAVLVSLLLATQSELSKAKGPILFPIFGRGRVLPGMHHENLNRESIGKAAEFVCSPRASDSKAVNPGIDLLVSIDWKATFDKLIADGEAAAKEKATTKDGLIPGLTFVTPTPPTPAPRPLAFAGAVVHEPMPDTLFWLWFGVIAVCVLVVAIGAWVSYTWQK